MDVLSRHVWSSPQGKAAPGAQLLAASEAHVFPR